MSTTLEKLFVQIFDRKNWIEDQLKQQRDLYDQYLASTLLINGIRPPSWLLSSGFDGGSADLKELKKEELISGLLFPPPRPKIPSNTGHNNLYVNPVATESNVQQSDGFTETCASNKYFFVGDKVNLVSDCNIDNSENDVGCTLKGVPELDHASPQRQTEQCRRMSVTNFKPEQSLVMIHRSRSRQKALELRNSADSKPKKRPNEDCTSISSGRFTRSRTSGQPDNLPNLSNMTNGSDGRVASSDRVTRSWTSVQPNNAKELLELQNPPKTSTGSGVRVTLSGFASQKVNSNGKPSFLLNFLDEKDHDNTFPSENLIQNPSSQNNQELYKSLGANTDVDPHSGDYIDDCGGRIMSEMIHLPVSCDGGLLKPDKSSKSPSDKVTPKSNSSSRSSQLPNLLNSVEPQNLPKESDAPVIVLPYNDYKDIAHHGRCSTAVAETELVSELAVEACLDHSRSNIMACSLGMAKGVLAPSSLAEDNTYVEPKRLIFDEVENSDVNKCCSHTPEKETGEGLSEMGATPLEPQELSRKVVGSNLHKRFRSVDSHFQGDHDLIQVNREENRRASYDTHEDRCNSVRKEKSDKKFQPGCTEKISDFSVMLSREEIEIYEEVVADLSTKDDNISEQQLLEASKKFGSSIVIEEISDLAQLVDGNQIIEVMNSECQRASLKISQEKLDIFDEEKSNWQLNPTLSTGKVLDTSPSLSSKKGTPYIAAGTVSGSKEASEQATGPSDHLTAILDKECELDPGEYGSPESRNPHPSCAIPCSSLLTNYDSSFQDQETEYVVAADTALISVQRQSRTPNVVQATRQETPHPLRSYNTKKNDLDSTSSRSFFVNKSMQPTEMVCDANLNSWPLHKRRKLEGRSSEGIITSTKLGCAEPFQRIDIDNPNMFFQNIQDGSGSDLHFFCSSSDVEVAHSNFSERPDAETYQSEKRRKTERYRSSSELQAKEGDGDGEHEGEHRRRSNSLGAKESFTEPFLFSNLNDEAKKNSQHCLNDKVGLADTSVSEDHQNFRSPNSRLNLERMKQVASTEEILPERQSDIRELFPSVVFTKEDVGLNVADQDMPEFEGFSIGMPMENIQSSLAEDSMSIDIDHPSNICRSTSMLTPLSHSSKYSFQKIPDIYQSLPNGMLESMNLRNSVFSDDGIKQLKISLGVDVDHASYSDSLASSSVQYDWGVRKPPTPPIRRACQKITSISAPHSSEKRQSVNPELTCFRIDEDTSTSEGNENLDEVVDVVQEGSSPRDNNSSTDRNPLTDMTNTNRSASVSVPNMYNERGSLDSVNTELNFNGTHMGGNQNIRNGCAKTRISKNKDKENQSSSVGVSGVGKSASHHNRFSRPQLSSRVKEKKESQSFSGKGNKQTNIVSNISSFIPLVQQKQQQAAHITGKRDIKVKALEAADAAKRLEEKKVNERKMKKEAAKVERAARLEQEKIKQMELKQKNKEEERKRKDANMPAKKRPREEDERKEKEKRRKCMKDTRRQHKEEKLRVGKDDKEPRRKAADEREGKKELKNEVRKHQKTEKGREIADCRKITKTCSRTAEVSAGNAKNESDVFETAEAIKMSPDKAENNLSGASDYGFFFNGGNGEQSYEISPYQASEDEEEGDAMANKKFTPSWARKTNLASVLPFLEQLDPYKIFPPASFCNVAEVVIPRMPP